MDYGAKNFPVLSSIALAFVGFQIVRRVLPWFYLNIIGPKFFGPRVDVRRLGAWAVITGATDGIGKSYAKLLAKKGLNLVLISRSLTKLETVSKEFHDAYNVETKIVDIDFTDGPEIFQKIRNHLEGLDVGILVNNVGISYPYPEYFIETYEKNPKFFLDIISANIHSVTHMCALLLPGMISKKKGVIVNISSTAAVIPNPLLSVYSATKAFVDKFSADLQTEYQSKGVIIQSVQPGFVATNMTKIRKPTLFAPSADTYVESAFKTIGIADNTAGYWVHSLLQSFVYISSTLLGDKFARKLVLNNLAATRQRALRNLAKKQ